MLSPRIPNRTQNGNPGTIRAYSYFSQVAVTGLIGALLIVFFQIPDVVRQNSESLILREGKPPFLFPIGRRISAQVGWGREMRKWGCGFFCPRLFLFSFSHIPFIIFRFWMTRAAQINPAKTTMSTPQSTNGENADVPDIAALNRSTRYVRGEQ
jgi:hypothetical protein